MQPGEILHVLSDWPFPTKKGLAMKVALWAEIRRLAEIEKLSRRAISRRLHCSRYFVRVALKLDQPPTHGFRMAAASWTRTRPRLAYSWPKILTSPESVSARRLPSDRTVIRASPLSSAAT